MNLKKFGFTKTIRQVFIPFIVVCIGLAFMLCFAMNSEKKVTHEIKEMVQYTMEDYLSEFGVSNVTVNTLEQPTTSSNTENITTLSKEEQQAIIDSVVGTLEPKMYKQINSSSENMRQQIVSELEIKLDQSITETIETKLSETVVLSEDQKKLLIDNTAIIVETKFMEKLRENSEKNAEAVSTLERSISNNITKIESTLNSYDAKLQSMENSINELKTVAKQMNVSNAGSVTNIEQQISVLQNGYDSFRKEYITHIANALTVTNLVNDLTTEPSADTDVMSAKAGYKIYSEFKTFKAKMEEDLVQMGIDINQDIMNQINQLNRSIISMGKRIDELEISMSDNLEELETASATKDSLEQVKRSMESALNSTKIALETQSSADLEAAYNQLEAAINEAGDRASQDLLDAKDLLNNALNGTAQEAEQALNAAKSALESDIGNVNLKIQEVDAKISEINSTITSIKTDIGKLKEDTTDNYEELKQASATKTELANAKTSLDQSLSLTNQNIANLDTMTSEKLRETKAALDQAIIDMGNQAGQDLIDARDALQAAIDNNITDIGTLQSTLTSAQQAITNNKSSVESKLNTINDSISNMNNSITSVKSEVESIKSNQVTYVWDSDENGSVLRIITP